MFYIEENFNNTYLILKTNENSLRGQEVSRLLPRLIHKESIRFFSQNIIKSLATPGLRALITIDYDFRDERLRIVVR